MKVCGTGFYSPARLTHTRTTRHTISMLKSRLAPILSDIQFWVPIAVLVAGALILYWVSR